MATLLRGTWLRLCDLRRINGERPYPDERNQLFIVSCVGCIFV